MPTIPVDVYHTLQLPSTKPWRFGSPSHVGHLNTGDIDWFILSHFRRSTCQNVNHPQR